jgi:hypothetical protein
MVEITDALDDLKMEYPQIDLSGEFLNAFRRHSYLTGCEHRP